MIDTSNDERRQHPPLTPRPSRPSTHPVAKTDGRVLRRSRNMAAVREAIVELLAERAELTIAMVARRAGVAGRSVYRYHGDLDSAVRDAVIARLDSAIDHLPDPASIDLTLPLDERIGQVSAARVHMWSVVAPVLGHLPPEAVDAAMVRLDSAIVSTFTPELVQFADDDRAAAESTLAVMVRMRSINSLAGRFDDDVEKITAALSFAIRRLLTPTAA